MHAIRGENFHRWRKEHESVVGVDAHSGHERDIFDYAGNLTGRSGGGQGRRHTLGDGLTEKTTDAAGDGLRVVAEALKGIIEHTLAVLPTVTGGYEVTYDGKKLKKTRQIAGPRATAQALEKNADHGPVQNFATRLAHSVTSHAVTLAVLAVRRVCTDDTKTDRRA